MQKNNIEEERYWYYLTLSLFNGISTFMGYLMQKTILKKNSIGTI